MEERKVGARTRTWPCDSASRPDETLGPAALNGFLRTLLAA
jgi:hypothetical protein